MLFMPGIAAYLPYRYSVPELSGMLGMLQDAGMRPGMLPVLPVPEC